MTRVKNLNLHTSSKFLFKNETFADFEIYGSKGTPYEFSMKRLGQTFSGNTIMMIS